jgi:hypothetical protein
LPHTAELSLSLEGALDLAQPLIAQVTGGSDLSLAIQNLHRPADSSGSRSEGDNYDYLSIFLEAATTLVPLALSRKQPQAQSDPDNSSNGETSDSDNSSSEGSSDSEFSDALDTDTLAAGRHIYVPEFDLEGFRLIPGLNLFTSAIAAAIWNLYYQRKSTSKFERTIRQHNREISKALKPLLQYKKNVDSRNSTYGQVRVQHFLAIRDALDSIVQRLNQIGSVDHTSTQVSTIVRSCGTALLDLERRSRIVARDCGAIPDFAFDRIRFFAFSFAFLKLEVFLSILHNLPLALSDLNPVSSARFLLILSSAIERHRNPLIFNRVKAEIRTISTRSHHIKPSPSSAVVEATNREMSQQIDQGNSEPDTDQGTIYDNWAYDEILRERTRRGIKTKHKDRATIIKALVKDDAKNRGGTPNSPEIPGSFPEQKDNTTSKESSSSKRLKEKEKQKSKKRDDLIEFTDSSDGGPSKSSSLKRPKQKEKQKSKQRHDPVDSTDSTDEGPSTSSSSKRPKQKEKQKSKQRHDPVDSTDSTDEGPSTSSSSKRPKQKGKQKSKQRHDPVDSTDSADEGSPKSSSSKKGRPKDPTSMSADPQSEDSDRNNKRGGKSKERKKDHKPTRKDRNRKRQGRRGSDDPSSSGSESSGSESTASALSSTESNKSDGSSQPSEPHTSSSDSESTDGTESVIESVEVPEMQTFGQIQRGLGVTSLSGGKVVGWNLHGPHVRAVVEYKIGNSRTGRIEPGRWHDFEKTAQTNIAVQTKFLQGKRGHDQHYIKPRYDVNQILLGTVYWDPRGAKKPWSVLHPKSPNPFPWTYQKVKFPDRANNLLVARRFLYDILKQKPAVVDKMLYERAKRQELDFKKAQSRRNGQVINLSDSEEETGAPRASSGRNRSSSKRESRHRRAGTGTSRQSTRRSSSLRRNIREADSGYRSMSPPAHARPRKPGPGYQPSPEDEGHRSRSRSGSTRDTRREGRKTPKSQDRRSKTPKSKARRRSQPESESDSESESQSDKEHRRHRRSAKKGKRHRNASVRFDA